MTCPVVHSQPPTTCLSIASVSHSTGQLTKSLFLLEVRHIPRTTTHSHTMPIGAPIELTGTHHDHLSLVVLDDTATARARFCVTLVRAVILCVGLPNAKRETHWRDQAFVKPSTRENIAAYVSNAVQTGACMVDLSDTFQIATLIADLCDSSLFQSLCWSSHDRVIWKPTPLGAR